MICAIDIHRKAINIGIYYIYTLYILYTYILYTYILYIRLIIRLDI